MLLLLLESWLPTQRLYGFFEIGIILHHSFQVLLPKDWAFLVSTELGTKPHHPEGNSALV